MYKRVQSQESAGMLHHLSGGAWDPHDVNVIASTSESSIQFWDLRTMKKTNSLEYSHVCSMDYDSKKEHMLITDADDSGINIWDLRMLKGPCCRAPWTFTLDLGSTKTHTYFTVYTCILLDICIDCRGLSFNPHNPSYFVRPFSLFVEFVPWGSALSASLVWWFYLPTEMAIVIALVLCSKSSAGEASTAAAAPK
nr:retrovirus-related Pol polyprotein from transposon 17.6 [Tanacetum cinerariifolium]